MFQPTIENKPMVAREQGIRPTNQISRLPQRIEPEKTQGDSEINNIFDEFGCPNMYVLVDPFSSSNTAD